ncbi:MAG: methyltransferase domain-containing protein [candidate division Zixibacteria bacterium]|nr:methyltransferase domain-containing protein [candidate division Zixibacteria bacterium]
MDWWEKYFDDNYLKLYSYTESSAHQEVEGVVRMLNIKPPAEILDLCCGFGRHSLVLAQNGFDVTGLDLSERFLAQARQKAETLNVDISLEHSDMRNIEHEKKFDAIINLFTAFGFFNTEEEDLKVLKGVAKALKPDGQFVIDSINRDYVIHFGQWQRWTVENGTAILEERFFDFFKSRLEINHRLVNHKTQDRKLESSFRLYTLREMLGMFAKVGLALTDVYGDFDGSQFSAKSPRMILVARRQD